MTIKSQPAAYALAVTPNDDTVIYSRAIYVGTAGNLTVKMLADETGTEAAVTFLNVPAGSLLPLSATRVMSTDTTATNIVRIW